MAARLTPAYQTFNTANGSSPLAGGKIHFYVSGSVSTNKDTFSDDTLLTANTNPLILDSAGRVQVDVWGDGNYKMVVADSNDTPIDTFDPVVGGSGITQIDTIADLTALTKATLTNGDEFYVSGYYAQGDQGGGTFYWDSSSTDTENGGTIIESDEGSTGRWLRIVDDTLTVKMFGAKGDGVTDDTTTIQAAIDTTIDGAELLFTIPNLTYLVGQLIFYHSGSYKCEALNGRFDSFRYISSNYASADAAFVLDGEDARWGDSVGYSPSFKNFVFWRTTQSGPCFGMRAIKFGTFKDCTFQGGTESLDINSGSGFSGYNTFTACRFNSGVNNPSWAHIGANLDARGTAGVNENYFTNCTFQESGTNLVLLASVGNNGHNVFTACDFSTAQDLGVSIGSGVGEAEFIGCRNEQNDIRDYASGGRNFQSAGENIRIIGGNYSSNKLATNERIEDLFPDGITVLGDIRIGTVGPYTDGASKNVSHEITAIRNASFPEFNFAGGNEQDAESTDVATGTDIITTGTHGYVVDDPVIYVEPINATGITGLTTGTTYYVIVDSTTTIQLAAAPAGGAINLTGAGTATASDPNRFILETYDEMTADWSQRRYRMRLNNENWMTMLPTLSSGSGSDLGVIGQTKPTIFSASGTFASGIYFGTGTPENVVTAVRGSIYLREDGGAGTSFYVKQVGSAATGWVGK